MRMIEADYIQIALPRLSLDGDQLLGRNVVAIVGRIGPCVAGPDSQFNTFAVYDRGAIALQELRNAVGDDSFFAILKTWAAQQKYGNGTIEQFIALAEKVSGKALYSLFDQWLFTKGRPAAGGSAAAAFTARTAPAVPKSVAELDRTHALLAAARR